MNIFLKNIERLRNLIKVTTLVNNGILDTICLLPRLYMNFSYRVVVHLKRLLVLQWNQTKTKLGRIPAYVPLIRPGICFKPETRTSMSYFLVIQ